MTEELTGHPMDLGWMPHRPETWKYRFASLRKPIVMSHWMRQSDDKGNPMFHEVPLEAGHRVKIVMVSRFGDVGITEDLEAENGYAARVALDDLCDFGVDK